jgi:hypothetical protein
VMGKGRIENAVEERSWVRILGWILKKLFISRAASWRNFDSTWSAEFVRGMLHEGHAVGTAFTLGPWFPTPKSILRWTRSFERGWNAGHPNLVWHSAQLYGGRLVSRTKFTPK